MKRSLHRRPAILATLAILLLLAATSAPAASAAAACVAGSPRACPRPAAHASSLAEEAAQAEWEAEEAEAEETEEEPEAAEEAGGEEAAEEPGEANGRESSEEALQELEEGGTRHRKPAPHGKRTAKRSGARISRLALTRSTRAALRGQRLSASRIAFSFTADRRTAVHVTLVRRQRARRRAHPRTLVSFSLYAAKGADRARLRGHARLAPGRYELALSPARGHAQSLVFVVR